MSSHLPRIAIFLSVAELGSFSKAADKLGLTKSVISHHVSKLEESLGATLIYRSTRNFSLSDEGRTLYEVASKSLADIDGAVADITTASDDPAGSLHIAMPNFLPEPQLEKSIWEFANRFQHVSLNLNYSDDRKELISGGFDIAFRLGSLQDSGLKAKKIADIPLRLVTAPSALADGKLPTRPEHLSKREFIALKQIPRTITLQKAKTVKTIELGQSRVHVDNIHAARDAALAGLGMITLPMGLCDKELESQRLIAVLPDWEVPPIPLYAVWNNLARKNSLTRRLLDFLDLPLQA